MSLYVDVIKFNTKIIKIKKPEGQFRDMTVDQALCFKRAVKEKLSGFMAAWGKSDRSEQINAITDIVYFALGTLVKMGITNEQFKHICKEIQASNMEKKILK